LSKRLTQREFEQRSTESHAILHDYSEAVYTHRTELVKIRCTEHDAVFYQPAGAHMDGHTRCHQCVLDRKMATRVAKRSVGLELNEKRCSTCAEIKDKSEFTANLMGADGLRCECRACGSLKSKERMKCPIEWQKKKEYSAEYTRNNRDKANAKSALRRANRNRATVDFEDKEFEELFLKEMYNLTVLRESATGFKWQVDHTVPLLSSFVCGLHWSGNLSIIPAFDNLSKGNRFWPDMW
jgi:hypothetical protein